MKLSIRENSVRKSSKQLERELREMQARFAQRGKAGGRDLDPDSLRQQLAEQFKSLSDDNQMIEISLNGKAEIKAVLAAKAGAEVVSGVKVSSRTFADLSGVVFVRRKDAGLIGNSAVRAPRKVKVNPDND